MEHYVRCPWEAVDPVGCPVGYIMGWSGMKNDMAHGVSFISWDGTFLEIKIPIGHPMRHPRGLLFNGAWYGMDVPRDPMGFPSVLPMACHMGYPMRHPMDMPRDVQ